MKNKYEIRGEITAIFLNSPKYGDMETLIDTEDLEKACEYEGKWYASYSKPIDSFYAKGNIKNTTLKLHRFLMNAHDSHEVDHINRKTLDNRRSTNLRTSTHTVNMQNVSANKGNKSGIRGVSWHYSGKWQSRIQFNKKQYTLGLYDDIKEAKRAVENARAKLMEGSIEYLNAIDRENLEVTFGLGDNPTTASITGIRGIGWDKRNGKWKARFQYKNKQIQVGYFDNIEKAKEALATAKKQTKSS